MKPSNKLRNILRENRDIIRKEKISDDCLTSFIMCLANEEDYSKNSERSKYLIKEPKFQINLHDTNYSNQLICQLNLCEIYAKMLSQVNSVTKNNLNFWFDSLRTQFEVITKEKYTKIID